MADPSPELIKQVFEAVKPYGLWPVLVGASIWRFFPQVAPIIAAWRGASNTRRKNDQAHDRNLVKLQNQANKPNVGKDG